MPKFDGACRTLEARLQRDTGAFSPVDIRLKSYAALDSSQEPAIIGGQDSGRICVPLPPSGYLAKAVPASKKGLNGKFLLFPYNFDMAMPDEKNAGILRERFAGRGLIVDRKSVV